jgi:hypothetical protein
MAILMQLPYQIFTATKRFIPPAIFAAAARRIAGVPGTTPQAHFFQDIAVPILPHPDYCRRKALPVCHSLLRRMAGGDQGNPR